MLVQFAIGLQWLEYLHLGKSGRRKDRVKQAERPIADF